MDLELTDEQRDVQDTVRAFVDDRVLPNAVANDQAHRLDMDVIAGMAKLGLLGVVIPQEYGGAGMDYVSEALVCEEIERGEAAFRTLISVHVGLNSLSLLRYGSEEVKQRFLVPQATGEKLGCFGLTEPEAGSDVAAMRTTAKRRGDTYVLNGQKAWISYASVADHALVFAKTDPAAKHKGITAFIVEMVAGYETSKLLVLQAAWMKDAGRRNTRETSLAKWVATEAAFKAAENAVRIHGAAGYSGEVGVERYLRNATAPIIYEGTSQIHKMMQAEHALGFRPLNGRDGAMSPIVSWRPPRPAKPAPVAPEPELAPQAEPAAVGVTG